MTCKCFLLLMQDKHRRSAQLLGSSGFVLTRDTTFCSRSAMNFWKTEWTSMALTVSSKDCRRRKSNNAMSTFWLIKGRQMRNSRTNTICSWINIPLTYLGWYTRAIFDPLKGWLSYTIDTYRELMVIVRAHYVTSRKYSLMVWVTPSERAESRSFAPNVKKSTFRKQGAAWMAHSSEVLWCTLSSKRTKRWLHYLPKCFTTSLISSASKWRANVVPTILTLLLVESKILLKAKRLWWRKWSKTWERLWSKRAKDKVMRLLRSSRRRIPEVLAAQEKAAKTEATASRLTTTSQKNTRTKIKQI